LARGSHELCDKIMFDRAPGAPVINRRRSVATTSRYGVVYRRFRFRRLR
jgi:hypothetical protein